MTRKADTSSAGLPVLLRATRCIVRSAPSLIQQMIQTLPPTPFVCGSLVSRDVPSADARLLISDESAGLVWACGLAAINQFFYPRQPQIQISYYLAQLFGAMMGRFAAAVLPSTVFFPSSRFAFTLNPGPWSLKEQSLITIMANVSYCKAAAPQTNFVHVLTASSYSFNRRCLLSTEASNVHGP